MDILVCVKRVPITGAKIVLTEDAQEIVTKFLGFTVSPHEECAVEEAIRLNEAHGGTTTVLTLGPSAAADQLRDAIAMGADEAVLLETDGTDWDAVATATAIVAAVQEMAAQGKQFDLLLFGNESADSGGYQVGIRVAQALDMPCVSGVKELALQDGQAVAAREVGSGREIYEVSLPAVIAVKEGINLPRYPPLRGRMRAKRADIQQITPAKVEGGMQMLRLMNPPEQGSKVQILGDGAEAAPKVVEIMKELGLVAT